ncbi:hypothetical protein BJV82DRAFT_586763 [Fennellomyces sp. T-0311]|nr:hypothetical protein BJV82DRAFT_586763 [Fennellomyces sp. T-0311]
MTQQNAADFYSSSLRKSASHPDLSPVMPSMTYTIHPLDSPSFVEQTTPSTSPLWRRFRARARAHPQAQAPAPQPEPTVSTSSLTSLCSQAASMIMPWAGRAQQQPPPPSMMHHHQQPMCRRGSPHAQPRLSFSTPTGGRPPVRRPRKKSSAPSAYPPPLPRSTLVTSSSIISSTSTSSSCYSRDSQSTCATSIAPSPTTSPTLRMIKIKVIYDVDNIIVIQVPRSITLTDLRARIAQKFSDPSISLPKDFVLLFNDTRSSASSNTSAASSFSDSGMATLIAKEQDLTMAMGSTWVRHEKVTLRCVA